MLECVANVAEGRDSVVIAALADACGAALLDVHFDADHNRSVFTLAADRHDDVASATRALARSVAAHVSIALHSGVHPWLGALDVVPFVALGAEGVGNHDAALRAHEFASWWAEMFGVPVFLYGAADDAARDLPSVRREAFVTRPPDFGPRVPHPRLGATAVGVRPPLVAINCELATDNVA
ncbi:MAG: glutamate formimidoyltransferase, partial [Acidimicrobiia bacterium]